MENVRRRKRTLFGMLVEYCELGDAEIAIFICNKKNMLQITVWIQGSSMIMVCSEMERSGIIALKEWS